MRSVIAFLTVNEDFLVYESSKVSVILEETEPSESVRSSVSRSIGIHCFL